MGVGPDARHQLAPADHFTGALNQGDQDVESPTAETNALVALEQQTLLWNQAKGAKRDRALARGSGDLNQFASPYRNQLGEAARGSPRRHRQPARHSPKREWAACFRRPEQFPLTGAASAMGGANSDGERIPFCPSTYQR